MTVTATATCALCGTEKPFAQMSPFASPTLGHHCDLALACKWFCEPCFRELRRSPRLLKRFEAFQDAASAWARASLRSLTDAELQAMESLPEGLRVTAEECERFNELRDKLEDPRELQSMEDNALLHKLCRVKNRNPYYYPRGELWDFAETQERFARLQEKKDGK